MSRRSVQLSQICRRLSVPLCVSVVLTPSLWTSYYEFREGSLTTMPAYRDCKSHGLKT